MKTLTKMALLQLCISGLPGLSLALTGNEVISATGVTAGFAIHLGCGDGSITTQLSNDGAILVHGLTDNEDELAAARGAIVSQGLSGIITVENYSDWDVLPYSLNTANLVVADLDELSPKGLSIDEIKRILAPGTGVAYIKQSGAWTQVTKPRPSGMDDWTHRDYDESANLVSKDRLVQPPNSLKWKSGYRNGPDQILNMRLAGGRVFYEWPHQYRDENFKKYSTDVLVGRDAFNGVLLWNRKMNQQAGKYRGFVVDDQHLYIDFDQGNLPYGDRGIQYGGPIHVRDAKTGELVRMLNEGAKSDHRGFTMDLSLVGDTLIQICRDTLYALDTKTGDQIWFRTEGVPRTGASDSELGSGAYYCAPAIDHENHRLFVGITPSIPRKTGRIIHWTEIQKILCLDLNSGDKIWESKPEGLYGISQMSYSDGKLAMYYATNFNGLKDLSYGYYSAVLDAPTGDVLWEHARDWYKSDEVGIGSFSTRNYWVRDNSFYLTNSHYLIDIDATSGAFNENYSKGMHSNGARCSRSISTDHFMVIGSALYIDYDNKKKMLQESARSACGTGPFIANGMVYFTPNKCECFEQVGGYSAFYSTTIQEPLPIDSRLESATNGYALSTTPASKPTFAGDAPSGEDIPTASELWRSSFSERGFWLSMPVARDWLMNDELRATQTEPIEADGMEYVALIHEHRLEARKNGQVEWYFVAGGRISSPPVIQNGLCIFGSHDGYVYACDAATGEMKYRFLAAPNRKKILVHSQVESSWPVYGVTKYEDEIYFTAGRHPDVDGGIYLYRMNPQSGEIVWHTAIRRNRKWQPIDDKYLPMTVGVTNARLDVKDGKLSLPRYESKNGSNDPWKSTTHGVPGFYLNPTSGEMVMDGEAYVPEEYEPFEPVGAEHIIRPRKTDRRIMLSGNSFYVPENGRAQIAVYGVSGRLIKRAFNKAVDAGTHAYSLPSLPGGYYVVELHHNRQRRSKSILIVE